MSRSLKTGLVYYLKYNRFRKDPKPLILCLYSNNDITHAINLNYLSPRYVNQVVDMVAKIATRRLTKHTYKLYHKYMKAAMPGVISKSYRTYKTTEITNPVVISRGFLLTRSFMKAFKLKYSDKDLLKVKKKVKKDIVFGKKHPRKIDNVIKKIDPDKLDGQVRKYMKEIEAIMKDQKFTLRGNK